MTVRGRTWPRRITAWAAVVLLAVAGLVLAGPASPAAAATAVQPPVPAGGVVRVTGKGGAYSTVWGNLTITQPAGAGWAVAFGCDQPRPLSSNVNFAAGQTVAAFVAVRTDALGAFCIYTAASAHVVFDQVAASPVLNGVIVKTCVPGLSGAELKATASPASVESTPSTETVMPL